MTWGEQNTEVGQNWRTCRTACTANPAGLDDACSRPKAPTTATVLTRAPRPPGKRQRLVLTPCAPTHAAGGGVGADGPCPVPRGQLPGYCGAVSRPPSPRDVRPHRGVHWPLDEGGAGCWLATRSTLAVLLQAAGTAGLPTRAPPHVRACQSACQRCLHAAFPSPPIAPHAGPRQPRQDCAGQQGHGRIQGTGACLPAAAAAAAAACYAAPPVQWFAQVCSVVAPPLLLIPRPQPSPFVPPSLPLHLFQPRRTAAPLCPPTAPSPRAATRRRPAWRLHRFVQRWRAACGGCRCAHAGVTAHWLEVEVARLGAARACALRWRAGCGACSWAEGWWPRWVVGASNWLG